LTCAWWVVGFGSVELESRTKSCRLAAWLHFWASGWRVTVAQGGNDSPRRRDSDRMHSDVLFQLFGSRALSQVNLAENTSALAVFSRQTRRYQKGTQARRSKYLLASTFTLVSRAI
jgi:hypothetical protein